MINLDFLFSSLMFIELSLPLLVGLFSFVFFASTKSENWNKYQLKIIRYIVFLILICSSIYFLYAIAYIDPELMFVYLFWPAPLGLSLIGSSLVTYREGTKIEKRVAIVSIIIAIISLIWPFIFITLRGYGVV